MRLEISLEPAGTEAASARRDWLADFSLRESSGQVEVDPHRCFEVLQALRGRCHVTGLTVNVRFHGKGD